MERFDINLVEKDTVYMFMCELFQIHQSNAKCMQPEKRQCSLIREGECETCIIGRILQAYGEVLAV